MRPVAARTGARYAAERLLYRLSRSPHADRFVLKGALMLIVWLGESARPTRDMDLLGFGALDAESLTRDFAAICAIPVEPDGLEFDARSIRIHLATGWPFQSLFHDLALAFNTG